MEIVILSGLGMRKLFVAISTYSIGIATLLHTSHTKTREHNLNNNLRRQNA